MARGKKKAKTVESLTHRKAKRVNIPTAELEPVMADEERSPLRLAFERRNRDLDPQLVWRGKDIADWSDLVVHAPPLYIQEKVHPKVLIDDLLRESRERAKEEAPDAPDLFADFNGLPDQEAKTEFYQHAANWSNRMILGDSLQVMASLAEREGLRGRVQCIYVDPPYGIKFNSNFQWSTTSRDVKDGKVDHITREPEQVKAFRDTWRDGIHSYLTYLRDRLTVARDLLADSGSIFVQIGDENVHRVRALLDEVFGEDNFCGQISFRTTGGQSNRLLASSFDILLWYARDRHLVKYRALYLDKPQGADGSGQYVLLEHPDGARPPESMTAAQKERTEPLPEGYQVLAHDTLYSSGAPSDLKEREFAYRGRTLTCPPNNHWKPGGRGPGMNRLAQANRFLLLGSTLRYKRYWHDFRVRDIENLWIDTGRSGFADKKRYVVETAPRVLERCVLMTTDPGDLVLDPTCGSGTTAFVAEQWGRRWITIDTSRVALALARARIMGARYPYYLLADSPEGQKKEAEVARKAPSEAPTHGDIRQGFVYERVPHITLKSIANNAEIDVIWERLQPVVEEALAELNRVLKGHNTPFNVATGGREGATVDFSAPEGATVTLPSGEEAPANALLEWEVPRDFPADWPEAARAPFDAFWEARIARQKEIDASIAANADHEVLYDKPYVDNSRIRVAGPFTVESISPHRVLAVDERDELIDELEAADGRRRAAERGSEETDFATVVLDHLKSFGVQQAHKEDRIDFGAISGWPGRYVCAEGRYIEGSAEGENGAEGSGTERRAAIFIGPEFGTVARPDLVAAAREAADGGFDVLIACAFNFDAHAADFDRLGKVPVLKARMNPDMHMADELKMTGKGNLFVVFGEPDIDVEDVGGPNGDAMLRVRIKGVDVFRPQTGEIEASGPDGIACWFIDTDYNEESFFVRHAYFLGAPDPYKSLKTTLKAEIDEEAWQSLHSDVSRPFPKPASGRIAVKVINHLGDEVMKVFGVN